MKKIVISIVFVLLVLNQNLLAKQNSILTDLIKMENENNWRIISVADFKLSSRQIGLMKQKILNLEKVRFKQGYKYLSITTDGKQVLFIRPNEYGTDTLELLKTGQEQAIEIFTYNDISSAVFSLNENVILFVSSDTLKSYNLISREEKKIADKISVIDGLFPDGKNLLCEYWTPWEYGKSQSYEIFRVNIETGEKEKLLDGKYAALSPDGKQVIYKENDYKDDTGRFHNGHYYVLNIETAKKDLLLKSPQGATEYRFERPVLWSPDGKYALFTKGEGWKGQLTDGWVMELATRKMEKIGFTGLAWIKLDPQFEEGKEEKPIKVFKWWHNFSYDREKD
jgi:hypothetical protein